MEAPVTSAMAGPIQQMAAKTDATRVPALEMFSFFTIPIVEFISKKYNSPSVKIQLESIIVVEGWLCGHGPLIEDQPW